MQTDPPAPDLPPQLEVDLLAACLDSPDGDRQAALNRICSAHPDRAGLLRELYGLLDAYGLVDEPVEEPAADQARPERIGPYRVLELLGQGGMGAVYAAEHLELGRRVALKVLHPAVVHSEHARRRFWREALAASRLDHPSICPVYEVGSAGGAPYLAMREVPGRTLAAAIRAGRAQGLCCVDLPRPAHVPAVQAVLRFVETVARALQAAHEAGLVHRDVKPGNLMVTPDGVPVLLDFGLAVLEDEEGGRLTRSGDQLGTPCYMAPEQIAGRPCDPRADVWALGVVLYECLTLRLPFDAPNQRDLQSQILRDEPTDPRPTQPAVGRELWTVLQTALAKEPAQRYRSAAALAEDLRRLREHQTILARPSGPVLRLRRFVRRNPWAASLVSVLFAALAGFAVLLEMRTEALARTDEALDQAAAALRTARANEQALRARGAGAMSPRRGLESALAAAELERNLETVSALHAALVEHRELAVLQHQDALWVAAFSPDGELVLTCSDDAKACLWDRQGRKLVEVRHEAFVDYVEFAPDGRRFVTSGADGAAVVWDLEGREIHRLVHEPVAPETGKRVWFARFDLTGRWIATTCSDRCLRLWDARTGQMVGRPIRHEGPGGILCWSGERLALGSNHGDRLTAPGEEFHVLLYAAGAEGLERLARFDVGASVAWLDYSPGGGALLVACYDGLAYVLDLDGDSAPLHLEHPDQVRHARFAPDGSTILTACQDGGIRLWSRTGRLLHEVRQARPVIEAIFAGGAERILSTGIDDSVRLYDGQLRELLVLRGHLTQAWSARMSPDGMAIASASWDRTGRLWSLHDPRVPRLLGHGRPVAALAYRPDGSVVSAGDDRTVRVWDLSTGVARVLAGGMQPLSLVIGDDPRFAVVGHWDSIVRVYDLDAGREAMRYPEPEGIGVVAVPLRDGRILTSGWNPLRHAFSADGATREPWGQVRRNRTYALARAPGAGLIAGAGWGPFVTIWNEAGDKLAQFLVDPAWTDRSLARWACATAFSPDERRLAIGVMDGVTRVYDLDGGVPVDVGRPLRLDGHDNRVSSVAWSPDGFLLASGGSDGAARLWDARSGALLAVLRGHQGGVNAVCFTADGRLLTGGDDGAIQAWVLSIEELMDLARRRLGR